MDYRKQLNGFAVKEIDSVPEIPDNRLMVGEAELLRSVPLSLYRNLSTATNKAILPTLDSMGVEDTIPNFSGINLETTDFPLDFYVGEGGY